MATRHLQIVPATSPGAAGPPWRHWNTLQRLWASLYFIWALDAVLLMTAILGADVHREAVKGVGQDTAPSIIHALHIKTALADMDANIANELLGEPGQMQRETKGYEDRRKEASTALIEAAKNITFDEDEQKPIEAIQVAMGTYEAMVQRARDLHDRGDPGVVRAYLDAAKVMDEQLLPETDKLDQVNHKELEDAYSSLSRKSVGTAFLLLAAGGVLLAVLVAVQRFLNHQMHRILNPALLAASLVTLWFISNTFVTLAAARHDLKVAKEDAFVSIHALLRGRAVAYSANTDESRYLLDIAHAKDYERLFNDKALLLGSLHDGTTIESVQSAARKGRKLTGFTGFLADELNNITFDGERDEALTTLATYGEYLRIDDEMRQLQESGKHAEAMELVTGTKTGESNWAFDQFDQALGRTLKINQDAFDAAVERGNEALAHFELKASAVALVIALLAFFGLLKRIQEYR